MRKWPERITLCVSAAVAAISMGFAVSDITKAASVGQDKHWALGGFVLAATGDQSQTDALRRGLWACPPVGSVSAEPAPLGGWIDSICSGTATSVAHFTETIVAQTVGGQSEIALNIALQVPSSSDLVLIAETPQASSYPGTFAELILDPSAGIDQVPFTFGPPQLQQTSVMSPVSPAPTGVIQPLATVRPATDSTITLSGTGVAPLGRHTVSADTSPLLTHQFSLQRRLSVDAGPLHIYDVIANGSAAADIVREGNHLVATPDDSTSFQIDIGPDPPLPTTAIKHPAHSSADPNFGDVDSLLFALLGILPVLLALLLLRGRSATDSAAVATASSVAALAVTVSAVTGILYYLLNVEQRFGRRDRPALFGSEILAVVVVGAILPMLTWSRLRGLIDDHPLTRRGLERAPSELAAVMIVASLLAVLAGFAAFVLFGISSFEFSPGTRRWAFLAIGGALTGTAVLCTTVATSRLGLRRRLLAATTACLICVIGFEGIAAFRANGLLTVVLVGIFPLGMLAFSTFLIVELGIALAFLVTSSSRFRSVSDRADPRAAAAKGLSWPKSPWLVVHPAIAMLSIVLVLPAGNLSITTMYTSLNWITALDGLYRSTIILNYLVVLALIWAMKDLGRIDPTSSGVLFRLRLLADGRRLAIALSIVVFAPTASWWFLPVAFAVSAAGLWWYLLPANARVRADALAAFSQDEQNELIHQAVDAVAARKSIADRRVTVLSSSSTSRLGPAVAETKLVALRKESLEWEHLPASTPRRVVAMNIGLAEACFSHAAGLTSWERAKKGALVAAVLSIPWMVLGIRADVRSAVRGSFEFRLSAYALDLPFTVGRWVVLGLIFGWSYPFIRGRNGLSKSLAFLLTITVPILLTTVLPGPASRGVVGSAIANVAETASVLLLLGLGSDLALLHRAGYGISELVQLRRLSAVVTWVTSLTVAIGAAVSSIVVGGLTSAFVYFSSQNTPPANDSATSSASGTK
jgi:hypothetical protein